jgi:hypothetical protein
MDRKATLARVIGPFVYERRSLSWEFTARRDINHRLKRVTGRKFVLSFDARTRQFRVTGYRRISKREKRREVMVSRAMLAYLRSRLAPADIARCTVASLTGKAA